MNNPWIPHRPGDPMPVDGDTEIVFQNYRHAPMPAKCFNWAHHENTAYRIHKKEREMKYKAGDEITIRIGEMEAALLNKHAQIGVLESEIIAHEPAPEPVVFHFGLRNDGGWEIIQNSKRMDFTDEVHTKITVALNHATKEVKAEIVE